VFEAHVISAGERLPFGIEVFAGRQSNDLLIWVESRRPLICGDTLVDFGGGLEIHDEWLWDGVTRDQVVRRCARCSSCRWSLSSQHTAGRRTNRLSSARSPETLRGVRVPPVSFSAAPRAPSDRAAATPTEARM
jgi:hypothetical protein